MASIDIGSLTSWGDGTTFTAANYDNERNMIITAVNDNDSRINSILGTSYDGTTSLMSLSNALATHKTSGDHDSRYFTQTQINTMLVDYLTTANAASTYLTQTNAASTYHTVSAFNTAIASYYTKTQVDSTFLTQTNAANTYLTQTQTDARYYTKTQADGKYVLLTDTRLHNSNQVGNYIVNEGGVADGKVLMYSASVNELIYQSVPGLSGQTVVADGTLQTNLNADKLHGYVPGNIAGSLAILDSNGKIDPTQVYATNPAKASTNEQHLTSTSMTTIATYTPTAQHNYMIGVYLRVTGAATTVTCQVTYADATGAQTNVFYPATSVAVGSGEPLMVFINAVAGTAINIQVQGGTANNVYASASIVEV